VVEQKKQKTKELFIHKTNHKMLLSWNCPRHILLNRKGGQLKRTTSTDRLFRGTSLG